MLLSAQLVRHTSRAWQPCKAWGILSDGQRFTSPSIWAWTGASCVAVARPPPNSYLAAMHTWGMQGVGYRLISSCLHDACMGHARRGVPFDQLVPGNKCTHALGMPGVGYCLSSRACSEAWGMQGVGYSLKVKGLCRARTGSRARWWTTTSAATGATGWPPPASQVAYPDTLSTEICACLLCFYMSLTLPIALRRGPHQPLQHHQAEQGVHSQLRCLIQLSASQYKEDQSEPTGFRNCKYPMQDYDEKGDYIRTWVPELAKVPAPSLFEPWKLSTADQQAFGVQIGVRNPFARSLTPSTNRCVAPSMSACGLRCLLGMHSHRVRAEHAGLACGLTIYKCSSLVMEVRDCPAGGLPGTCEVEIYLRQLQSKRAPQWRRPWQGQGRRRRQRGPRRRQTPEERRRW